MLRSAGPDNEEDFIPDNDPDPNPINNPNFKFDMKLTLTLSLIAALFLVACADEKVGFETLELQRSIANENARFNAQKWRAENGFEKLGILGRGDSTQQANCPQGDGWASVDLTDPQTKAPVVKLKCSTVSGNVGCYKDEDFKARPALSTQENKCNAEIPKNLKKIEG